MIEEEKYGGAFQCYKGDTDLGSTMMYDSSRVGRFKLHNASTIETDRHNFELIRLAIDTIPVPTLEVTFSRGLSLEIITRIKALLYN